MVAIQTDHSENVENPMDGLAYLNDFLMKQNNDQTDPEMILNNKAQAHPIRASDLILINKKTYQASQKPALVNLNFNHTIHDPIAFSKQT